MTVLKTRGYSLAFVALFSVIVNSSTALGNCRVSAPRPVDPASDRFLIVGAGVSGIATATELLANGVEPSRITIFERNDYVGGKVKSYRYQDR